MKPLTCTWAPFDWSNIGWKNFRNWTNSGFPNITFHQDGLIHRKLSSLAMRLVGDPWQPFTYKNLGHGTLCKIQYKTYILWRKW